MILHKNFRLLVMGLALMVSRLSGAAISNYEDVIVGERASGMAGAFTAIADDPSGMLYNPAGLVYAQDDYISLSVNSFQSKTLIYKDIFPGKDYTLKSNAFIPAFFGFINKYDFGAVGFSVIVKDMQSFDQNDRLEGLTQDPKGVYAINRQFSLEAQRYLLGPSVAIPISSNLSVGLSLFAKYTKQKFLDAQLNVFNPGDAGPYILSTSYLNESTFAFEPRLGILYSPVDKVSIGLNLIQGFHLTGKGSSRVLVSQADKTDQTTPKIPVGKFNEDLALITQDGFSQRDLLPFQASLGVAWYPSKDWLWAADFRYYGADPAYLEMDAVATFNASLGAEYYLDSRLPLRLGIFTNRAATPPVSQSSINQDTHIDFYGGSAGLSFVSPGSSLSMSFQYSTGSGESQIISNTTAVQKVVGNQMSVFFSGAYQL